MQKTETKYIVEEMLDGDGIRDKDPWGISFHDDLPSATQHYEKMCYQHPSCHFRLIMREVQVLEESR